MPLFSSEEDRKRKENLKLLEDRRLRFAEKLQRQGFCPERMLFCSREDGTFAALARHDGKFALIESPQFGEDADFTIDIQDAPRYERNEVFEPGTGLNGAFGFGTKGAKGFDLILFNSDGLPVKFPVVNGRNSWMEATYKKNPLLQTKRRRGDANVVWDFLPIQGSHIGRIEKLLDEYYLK